jgi:hypothetical protein
MRPIMAPNRSRRHAPEKSGCFIDESTCRGKLDKEPPNPPDFSDFLSIWPDTPFPETFQSLVARRVMPLQRQALTFPEWGPPGKNRGVFRLARLLSCRKKTKNGASLLACPALPATTSTNVWSRNRKCLSGPGRL